MAFLPFEPGQTGKYPARLRAAPVDKACRDHLERSLRRWSFREYSVLYGRCHRLGANPSRTSAQGQRFRQVLDALPAAVSMTDADGKITYYNKAAADLAGREPAIGKDEWCVTFRLFGLDGKELPHDQCPMAIALKENKPVRGVEAMAQRPDGTLFPFCRSQHQSRTKTVS